MCAAITTTLFTVIALSCFMRPVIEGRPLPRRGRDFRDDIIAGDDFLSLLMESSRRYEHHLIATTSLPEIPTTDTNELAPLTRETRSTAYLPMNLPKLHTEEPLETTTEVTTSEDHLRRLVVSEERPSLVAEASKSEFSVDEADPITSNGDYGYQQEVVGFEAKRKVQPLRETVIYHNDPSESGQARSVSYSTVIQALPHHDWEKQEYSGRKERHYEGVQPQVNDYSYESKDYRNQNNSATGPMAESNDYYVTAKYSPIDFNENTEKNQEWKKQETSSPNPEPVERNWGIPEKQYVRTTSRVPIVYGQPEQNYEVDEAVSVMSNGRTHGVQHRTQPPPQSLLEKAKQQKKADENQKVGYVVEGRNYRKYRVEERTPDGFIVGEYGVVSHDDGSLRGVRYTADGTINPRLIYDALMKFLSL